MRHVIVAVLLTVFGATESLAVVQGGQADQPAAAVAGSAREKAEAADGSVGADQSAESEATVTVANRTVATLRVPFLGVGPARRAQRAEAAIAELAALGGEGRVSVKVEPQGRVVMIDGQLAFILVAGDADRLRGQTLAQASKAAAAALQLALDETRETRNVERLLRASGIGAAATLAAGAILFGLWRLRRWVRARMAALVERGSQRIKVAGMPLLQTSHAVTVVGIATRVLALVVALFVVYEWLSLVLSLFPYTRPWGEGLRQFLVGIVVQLGRGVLQAMPDLAVAVAIFLIARGVIAAARPIFNRIVAAGRTEGRWLDADTARPTQRVFNVAVALFAVVMAYPYLPGSDSEAFKGMSVLIGLMVTMGGSSLFSQATSGLVIMYSRTVRVGEYVRIADHEGTVTKLGTFTTRIRTGLGEELTLPNALVLGTVTKNYSRAVKGRGYVVDTVVTIGYDTPWRQVEAMLIEAACRTPGVLADPAPRVFQTGLSDFYPEYRLVCQASPTEPRPRAEVLSMLHAQIQDVFNEHGVQIMSPHYLGDPAAAKVVPPDRWYEAPARRPDDPTAKQKG